jgi:hypothetical protein
MTVSFAENVTLTCPACGKQFTGVVWRLLDAEERPDLVEALRDEQLNLMHCPHCGNLASAGTPLLLHERPGRRVYFAAPADAAEHEVREQAQALLYALVESLPEEARLPYLGDVQVEQELEGVRRALLRNERRRGRGAVGPTDAAQSHTGPAAETEAAALLSPSVSERTPLLVAVHALLAADNSQEFEAQLAQEPRLLEPEADTLLGGLADTAFGQGERDAGEALLALRQTLRGLRGAAREQAQPGRSAKELPAGHVRSAVGLSDAAFAALMRAQSLAELADAVRDHPALLEPWADDEIGARVELALDEGNDRQAGAVEERRDALAQLRDELTNPAVVTEAVRALLGAGDAEAALAQTLSAYPVLLTAASDAALFRLAGQAQIHGDDALAGRARDYRAMLRTLRAGLEEP